jgi:predicted MFS family arabinose efflux permease
MIVVLATIVLIGIALKLKPITKHLEVKSDRNPILHLWHTLANREYRIGFMATALLSIGGFMMMPWGSAFSINNLHVTKEQLPLLFMVSGVSTLLIMPLVGRFSDKIDKFKLFTIASIWMMVVVVIYTNLTPVPFWVVMTLNVLMMIGIMSRIIPSMALVSTLPQMQDRGAFMSINSSLQQIAGGLAAGVGGLIVVQKTKNSPLEHYNTLGYLIIVISVLGIITLYRVSKIIKKEKHLKKV